MVDSFDRLYYLVKDKRGFLFSVARYLVRKTANFLIPIYYRCTNNNPDYSLNKDSHSGLVISLTSFPNRINDLWKVIESLLRQSHKPDRLILWLSKSQFKGFDSLPESLLVMQKRGLEIIFKEGDLRSHKKYFYTVEEFPQTDFVIVDDDVFYNSHTIETLVKLHERYPQMICCNLGDTILNNDGLILPYKEWKERQILCNVPCKSILPIGVGGVFYPARSLTEKVTESEVFMKICPKADDLWLWAMATVNGTAFVCSSFKSSYLPITFKDNLTLYESNKINKKTKISGNDLQLREIVKFLSKECNVNFNFSKK